MFIAIPLANKPSWRSPPWMTACIILINMVIFWGWQVPETRAVQNLAERYAASELPAIEVPHYIRHLEQAARAALPDSAQQMRLDLVKEMWANGSSAPIYQAMWHDPAFRQALLKDEVIQPGDPQYGEWQSLRGRWTPQEPRPFTTQWAQNFDRALTDAPHQLLTATFLHGSTDHLIGNMVFLFLFGFTLEMALGGGLYLLLYLLCGVGASCVSLWTHMGETGYGLGASGAISGLMAMYVVMYRLQRIQFFYMFFFYFNYARWPALVMLPIYMAHELLQQWLGGEGVDYMAHFGGLATGALLMAGLMVVKPLAAPANLGGAAPRPLSEAEAAALASVQKAQRLTEELSYFAASQAWRQAAKLQPRNVETLNAWFAVAQHFPESEDFHAAAKLLLHAPAADHAGRKRLHATYQTYLAVAKPGARLGVSTMVRLVPAFVALQAWDDARRLARALSRQTTVHPKWPDALLALANGLSHAQQMEQAMELLPALQAHAPQAPITQLLAQRKAAAPLG